MQAQNTSTQYSWMWSPYPGHKTSWMCVARCNLPHLTLPAGIILTTKL